ncbi:MAG: K(+)-transporting ATPase subunit F [Sulfobacillus benefaciens]|uniref:K(+)-transporting ATPase subunit F n=1 Tax=Sulfobacillus benefaciens TaxID=453960 RepID=A0A2T2XD74_9FIRM|nr:MAG: K(+)-transporting ATPase subunit F [Sulfobacillus benefaciens]
MPCENFRTRSARTMGNWVLLGLSIALMGYLLYVIVHPEKF